MNHFFKSSSAELTSAKEEIDMLRQKIKTVEAIASSLEDQLAEERKKNVDLKGTAQMWEDTVKAMDEAHRCEISGLRDELSIYKQIKEATDEDITVVVSESINSSLQGIRQEYELKINKLTEDTQLLQNRLTESDSLRAEGLKELEDVKAAYLRAEKRFREDIARVHEQYEVGRREMEKKHISELEELRKMAESHYGRELSDESKPEKHSELITALNHEIQHLNESNRLLQQDIDQKEQILVDVQQKHAEWREKVKSIKRQDNETIENLKRRLESASASPAAAEGQPNPQLSKELEKLNEKFEEERMMNRETIKRLQEQLTEAEKKVLELQRSEDSLDKVQPESDKNEIQDHDRAESQHQSRRGGNCRSRRGRRQKTQGQDNVVLLGHNMDLSCHQSSVSQNATEAERASQDHTEMERLRDQLEAMTAERDAAVERASQDHTEMERLRGQLNKSNDSLKHIESNLLLWKEKVKTAKLRDTEKISELETALSDNKETTATAVGEMKNLLSRYGGPVDNTTSLQELIFGFDKFLASVVGALALSLSEPIDEHTNPLTSMAERLHQRVVCLSREQSILQQANESLERDKSELQKELQKCEEEFEALKKQSEEVSNMVHQDELNKLLELNRQLEERCELLRKEVKRQREAFHRDRAHHELASVLVSTHKDSKETEFALRAAAGGVFEKDMLSLAATQSQRDNEIKFMRMKIAELEKENTDLKKSCEHNNKVIVEYTKEIEVMKSNQRVQVSIEYVKNIIYQFLCANEDLRMRLIPAIGTVLEFNAKEKQDILVANPKCPKFH
ncbi:unnamed protein product [Phytomonas sp. EM1]|nr:unnamed protein product [Phytomonas sp. EM1]|eukprot:CCW60462.1 unnamed protein product [Phytomonas sp. isolate EM1]